MRVLREFIGLLVGGRIREPGKGRYRRGLQDNDLLSYGVPPSVSIHGNCVVELTGEKATATIPFHAERRRAARIPSAEQGDEANEAV